ncbi:hypothetical protein SB749_19230, partial [Brevibacterium sp. SIMBA_078]|uniref:hypothetical protein n=1 Tax=Brevibacterium sp. SIMBA_078 TaxID=3085816 RepID=UPI00397E85E2
RNVSSIEKALGIMGGSIDDVPTEDNTLMVTGLYHPRQFVEVDDNLFRQVDGDEQITFVSRSGDGIDTMYFESFPFMGMERTPTFETGLFKLL